MRERTFPELLAGESRVFLSPWEEHYLVVLADLCRKARNTVMRPDRTNTGCFSGFGMQLQADLLNGKLPTLLSKTVHLKSVIHELLWFIRGETNISYLKENGVKIWDEWADANGDLGPVYGEQWRSWKGLNGVVDQLREMVHLLLTDPYSRRNVVSAWNPDVLPEKGVAPKGQAALGRQALSPCHMAFQAFVEDLDVWQRCEVAGDQLADKDRRGISDCSTEMAHTLLDKLGVPSKGLHLRVDQRSADWVLGVPFNIASYAILTHILAAGVGMAPMNVVMQFGDYHVYSNQLEAAQEQLERNREIKSGIAADRLQYGKLTVSKPLLGQRSVDEVIAWMENLEIDDFIVEGYRPWGRIQAPVAV